MWGVVAIAVGAAGLGVMVGIGVAVGLQGPPPTARRRRRVALDKWQFGELVSGRTIVWPAHSDAESTVELALGDIGFEELRLAVQLASLPGNDAAPLPPPRRPR